MSDKELFLQVLREFQAAGILEDIMLVGSWCHFFYKIYFNKAPEIPLVRTLDLDFLIPDRRKIKKEVDIPDLLKKLGFEPIRVYPSGYVKFGHPDLSIEFLVPEIGAGKGMPYNIQKLRVNAQGLRFLTMLGEHRMSVSHAGITIYLPEPAAYVLHKIIIGSRRVKPEKRQRDFSAAREIGEFLLKNELQRKKLKDIFNCLPRKWRDKIRKNAKVISRELHEYLS